MKYKKKFGQHFLKNPRFAVYVAKALELTEQDVVIEIGPGNGILTQILLESGATVICVEIDYDLIPNLIKRFRKFPNFKIINEDFLKLDINKLIEEQEGKSIKFTGNLPYNISKKIIATLITDNRQLITSMVFMVQDEVAKEYAAKAPKANFLSTISGIEVDIKKLQSVPTYQFEPKPKVDGGIILITPKDKQLENITELKKLIKIGYSSPRKKLIGNLVNSGKYEKGLLQEKFNEVGLDENARPAELAIDQWVQLNNKLGSTLNS